MPTSRYTEEQIKTAGLPGGIDPAMVYTGNVTKVDTPATVETFNPPRRYVENAVATAPTAQAAPATEPPKDKVAEYYEGLRSQYAVPDEARRAALRSEAQQEVQTQIDAINQAYMTLIADERGRQQAMAEQGRRQVSGIGRLSGLGGSSVQAQRQTTQMTKAQEAERQAVQAIQAKQAYEAAQTRGAATAGAEVRFKQEQDLALQAQNAYGTYLQSIVPKAVGPTEVGGVLIDPTTGKVIYDSRTSEGQKPIEVGGYLVDPVTGQVVFSPPDKAKADTYTLSPGQKVYDATGNLLAENPAGAASDKLTTVPKGSVVIDAAGNVVYQPAGGEAGLSGLAAAVAKDGKLLSTLTGSQQGEVLTELANAGYDIGSIARGYGGLTEQQLTTVNSLNDKFLANQVVKDYQTVQDQTATVNAIVNGGSSGPRDLATVFAFMKALDPNSVVREAEYDNAARSGNIFTGWAAKFNGYLKPEGGFMPDSVKKEFSAVVGERLKAKEQQYSQLRSQFIGTAKTLTGRNDADKFIYDVTTQYSGASAPPVAPPATPEEQAYVQQQLGASSALPAGTNLKNIATQLGIPADLYDRTVQAMGGDVARVTAWLKSKASASGKDFNAYLPKANGGTAAAPTEARRVANAIGQFESGGNYKALGPVLNSGMYKGDRAYGKYQVMGKNVPSWTKEAMGAAMTPQQFLADPKAQDKVAEYRMARMIAQGYDVEDIASIWFSGRPLAKAGDAKDQLGTSVPQYAKNVRAIYNRTT